MRHDRAADADAQFAAFFESNKDLVLRAVVVATGDRISSEDCVSEAFVRLYAKWRKLRTHPNLDGWLIKTSLNLHRSNWRKRRRETNEATREPAIVQEHLVELEELLSDLPERQRQVVACRLVLGLTTDDTAAALKMAPGTVKAHLSRATTTLRGSEAVRTALTGRSTA